MVELYVRNTLKPMKDMDRFMKDLARAMEKSGAGKMSEVDVSNLLKTFMDDGVPKMSFDELTPEEQAVECVYMAIDEPQDRKFRDLISLAFSLDPYCEQAYEALGDREVESCYAIAFYKMAMDVGLNKYLHVPRESCTSIGMFYGDFRTRPTIRSMYQYAECLLAIDATEKATAILEEIVRLNEHDNMGARFMLFHLLSAENQKQKFKKYLKQFPDDASADVNYAIALYSFTHVHGDTKELERVKEQALKSNAHIPKVFREDISYNFEGDSYRMGGEDEAHIYFDRYEEFWDKVKGAREWLESW